MSGDKDQSTTSSKGVDQGAEISVLDQALWSNFSDERDLREFARIWLALQIKQIGGVEQAAVVLEDEDQAFTPFALYPNKCQPSVALSRVIDTALEREAPSSVGNDALAFPLSVEGRVFGVAALQISDATPSRRAEAQKALQWGAGWLVSALRQNLSKGSDRNRQAMSTVLDLSGVVLDAGSYRAATMAAVNYLSRALDCAQVAIGQRKGRRVTLEAISDVADFRLNTTRTRNIEAAMAEVVDQSGTVLFPRPVGQEFMVTLAHAEQVREALTGDLMTVPLFFEGKTIGAVQFQKPPDKHFSGTEIATAEAAVAALGPYLATLKRTDRGAFQHLWDAAKQSLSRMVGPGYLGRKVALIAVLALAAFLTFAKGDYRITAKSEVQGQIVRTLSAPFDGHIFEASARAGDEIVAGQILAKLDERDLRIEILRWQTDLNRYEGEYDKALADRDASASRIASANIDQSHARLDLVTRQLDRANLLAPFDAIIIAGDLSQSIGTAVRRGEELFRIAPLRNYRVLLEVDETVLDEIEIGQLGSLKLASLPNENFEVQVNQITPSLMARDGQNVALVEAALTQATGAIRPGMRGVAKIDVERRNLARIWAQPIVDWARMSLWRWTP